MTKKSTVTVTGSAGATFSNVPSANISLGLSRASELTVQYAVNTWSLSAHRVVNGGKYIVSSQFSADVLTVDTPASLKEEETADMIPQTRSQRKSFIAKFREGFRTRTRTSAPANPARHQWYWSGMQEDTKVLTPNLKHTVKRHVLVTRIIPKADFPIKEPVPIEASVRTDSNNDVSKTIAQDDGFIRKIRELRPDAQNAIAIIKKDSLLINMLDFSFSVQV